MDGFWRRLFGGHEKRSVATQNSAPPNRNAPPQSIRDIGTSLVLSAEGRAEVLSQYRSGSNPKTIPPDAWQDFWTRKLGMSFRQASHELFSEGMLREASPVAKLAASRSLSELKTLSKMMKLKVGGRKAELAARLVESGDSELLAELEEVEVWICSEEALETVNALRKDKKARLLQIRLETLDLLKGRKLKEACELVCRYEQTAFFPRGIGINWSTADTAMHRNLKAVFAAQPKFHKRRFDGVSSELRERAGMAILWGTSNFGDIFPTDEPPDQVELFSRMLQFHATHLRRKKQFEKSALNRKGVRCKVVAADDQNTTCAACLDDNGKVYPVEKIPELPHEYCECTIGCRCIVVVARADES